MTNWMRKAKATNHRVIKKQSEYSMRYSKRRAKTDLGFRLKCNVRRQISASLRGREKGGRNLELLGVASMDMYREFLESKFADGMTWENYGLWHIDHIIPLSKFNLQDPNEQRLAFNYKNTRPLWAGENLKRGNRVVLADLD